MKSPFITNFLKNWEKEVFVFFLIWVILATIQIFILEKDELFSIFHGFLIAGLISIS